MKAYSKNNICRIQFRSFPQFSLMILVILFTACGGSKNVNNSKDFEQLRNTVHNEGFEIENQWLNPLGGSMINLIGNPNFIRFTKDSVNIFLPYFGERRSGGGYGNRSGGILYEGEPKELTITEDENEKNIMVRFSGQQRSENLRFLIILYPDGGANTSVTTSQRDAISYRGTFRVLPEKHKRQVDLLLDRQN